MKWMSRVGWGSQLAGLAAGAGLAWAGPPEVNLWVELRWVELSASAQGLAAARDGAVVVGTAGTVTPQGAGAVTTRSSPVSRIEALPRLLVRNGQRAEWQWSQPAPLQWAPAAVAVERGQTATVLASPQAGGPEIVKGFAITPRWPGGAAAVQAELYARHASESGGGATAVRSQLSLPLDAWMTVAVSSDDPAPGQTGAAAAQRSRELQLRVSRQP